MNIHLTNVIVVLLIAMVLISCGGSKHVKSTPKVITSAPAEPQQKIPEKTTPVRVVTPAELPTKSAPLAYTEKVQNYIYEYGTIAKKEMEAFGIPASITLAQGILESGAGYGRLSQIGNNHFGIKCHDWEGERIYHDDDKLQECFRKYDKASSSFKDHSLFLKNRKRYAKLFTYKKDDYKAWARGLKAAGYATDPKYPAKLISIIERYQLFTFDQEVLGKKSKRAKQTVSVDRSVSVTQTRKTKTTPAQREPKVKTLPVSQRGHSTTTQTPSGSSHLVQSGETLYAISRQYNTTVSALQSYNNLTNTTLSIGQVLRVVPPQSSPSVSSITEHIVVQGETLYSISKRYHSSVTALQQYNNLKSTSISVGQVLRVVPKSAPEPEEEF